MDFREELNRYKNDFEMHLNNYAKNAPSAENILNESINYTLFSVAKRIRPIIMLAFCDFFGGDRECVYPFACAIEMIHTYSLVHDDLPCMDNDTVRRGKPCNHIRFGEDVALLAGDALLTQAFEIVSGMNVKENMIKNQLRSINILAKCSGVSGMIAGQCLDLHMDTDNISADKVLELYRLKTSRLFCAAAAIGAVMSGADEECIDLAKNYGEKIGTAFQLVDDILDNEDKMLGAFKEENANELLNRLTSEAKNCIREIGGNNEFLMRLTDYLTGRSF